MNEVNISEIIEAFRLHSIELNENELNTIHKMINFSQTSKAKKIQLLEKLADEMFLGYIQIALQEKSK